MNRRSILSSLSLMFVAALAWPRQAEAGNAAKGVKTTYQTRVYNGYYDITLKKLVAGQRTYLVHYSNLGKPLSGSKDLLPGQTVSFQSRILKDTKVFIDASTTTPIVQQGKGVFVQDAPVLYVLVRESWVSQGLLVVEEAPAGVKF